MNETLRRQLARTIRKCDTEALRLLIQGGLDPLVVTEGDKWNLLHRANVNVLRPATPAFLQYLIDLGVDVNARDCDGWTPLHKAGYRGHVKAVKALLEAGADRTLLTGAGLTALSMAEALSLGSRHCAVGNADPNRSRQYHPAGERHLPDGPRTPAASACE